LSNILNKRVFGKSFYVFYQLFANPCVLGKIGTFGYLRFGVCGGKKPDVPICGWASMLPNGSRV